MDSTETDDLPEYGDTFFSANTEEGYGQNLSGAHRNPPPRIRPPAIVSHIGIWNPISVPVSDADGDLYQADYDELLRQARQERWTKADNYMASIWHLLVASDSAQKANHLGIARVRSPNIRKNSLRLFSNYLPIDPAGSELKLYTKSDRKRGIIGDREFDTYVQQVEFRFKWYGSDVIIHFEQRREYLSVMCSIDLSSCLPEAEAPVKRVKKTPIEYLNIALNILDKNAIDGRSHQPEEYEAISKTIYRDTWSRFYDHILKGSSAIEKDLGSVFLDFRGLILGAPFKPTIQASESAIHTYNFQGPFWRKKRKDAVTDQDVKLRRGFVISVEPVEWHDVLNKFWRFLTAPVDGINFSDYEFTASGMMGNEVLYATALGAQPASDIGSVSRVPVYYFMYSKTYNGWQLGRLVDQINFLGAMRLASMRYYDEFRTIGYTLDYCSEMIEASKRQYLENLANYTEDTISELDWRHFLEKLGRSITSINTALTQASAPFPVGLGADLQLARHYISEFKGGVESLHIRPVACFQPYDAFVLRRLGASFNSIVSINARFQNVRGDLEALQEFYRNQNNQLVELETRNRSKDLEELGNTADAALWGALIPYYGGSILFHYILLSENFSPKMNGLSWIFIWSLSSLVGVILNAIKAKRRNAAARYTSKENIIYILLITVIALSAAMFVSLKLPNEREASAVVVTDGHGKTLEDVLKQTFQSLLHQAPPSQSHPKESPYHKP